MPNNEEWYRGNGEDLENYGSSPQPRGGSHGGHDDYSDSKSQIFGRMVLATIKESSKSREKERDKGCDKERDPDRNEDRDRYRDMDRGKDLDRHHRDHYWYRSERRGRSRDRDDHVYHRSRDYERRRDHDRDRKDRHSRLMSQSRSWGRSEHRSRSRSSSGSKSKRISGFDVAPPASAMLAAASTGTSPIRRQCWATSPTVLTMDVRSDPWDHPSHSWNVSKHVFITIWAAWSSSYQAGSAIDSAGN